MSHFCQFLAIFAIFSRFLDFGCNAQTIMAKAILFSASTDFQRNAPRYMGIVEFWQQHTANVVQIRGNMTGLSLGKHGFHIHEKGDLTNGCKNAGGHFNPRKVHHGGPQDTVRHVGDLGNIETTGPLTTIGMDDNMVQLYGGDSIIGRAVVVHSGEDDMGRGLYPDSLTTGHAGSRVACGVIAIASDDYITSSAATATAGTMAILLTSLQAFMVVN